MKRYVRERGSSTVRELLRFEHRATCRITPLEVVSALARRLRAGDIDERPYRRAVARLRADLPSFHVIEVTPRLIDAAEPLMRRYPLRAMDAMHLAAALSLPAEEGSANELIVYDDRLRQVAAMENLRVRPKIAVRHRTDSG